MINRTSISIGQKIALAHISDIALVLILSEEVIKRLLARRADVFGDGLIPFFGIRKNRINIKHYAAEIEDTVPHDIADPKPGSGLTGRLNCASCLAGEEVRAVHGLQNMVDSFDKTSAMMAGVQDIPAFWKI
ncbi:hypothetical protein AUC45_05580 [Erythrobacter sp. YT30]|nr:hypothetical protein AUC45_05580 [Erythrobacter sp. YT30]